MTPDAASATTRDSATALEEVIGRYNAAWNAHDVDAIMRMHAAGMVFDNVSAGETASGDAVRDHIAGIFKAWPDITFTGRRTHIREGLVVQEWTATATHTREVRRGDRVIAPTGREIRWNGIDIMPFKDGLLEAKIVYSDSLAILTQLGLV
jgi:steroid delta-isomerase-like uncharacterized protein